MSSFPAGQRPGTLYYNYISEQNYGSKVDTSKQYKRSGSPNLSDITFVAAAGYRERW